MDWISFYDFKHSVIYVNGRHRDVHYETIAKDIRALVPSPDAVLMDYGCGEATSAALVADACRHLTLVEAAPNVRAALRERYASNAKITVMTPDEAAATAPGTVDMIVLHSVAQYLTAA
jgi:16S rRNA A1518/A1519 N6-dimethyltransferase RsmA/KsgA/DIM1 with predicted DNA glycosylase/AP lyase activity